ncbi:MAG: glycosyltransferase family 4 protein [Gammaproteobacteria bacterium]|nr:glycosyltransferase family 4 protein [Gammaproteobacteria bacterium]
MPSLLWINQFALLPGDGGGTRHFELGRELAGKGWRVTILASDLHLHRRQYSHRDSGDDRQTIYTEVDGVRIGWVWAARYQRNDWRRAWNWLTFYRSVVREYARSNEKPDIVIGSSPQLLAAAAGRRVARKLGVPFVFEVRDLWPESLLAAGGRRGMAYHLLARLASRLYDSADTILVLARGSRDYLIEQGVPARKIAYVPNGVDINLVTPAAACERSADKPFTLIYAGAHGPANGLDRVVEAAAMLGRSANVRILLVGDGPIKNDLREEAGRRHLANVEFHEPVSKFRLAEMLRQADAGLMVLRDAPLFSFAVSPNKLFDYLAAGLPVVCNVPGDVAQMVDSAAAGIQAQDTSAAALAAAISKMASLTLEQRRQMGVSGRKWVATEHSREVLGENLHALLRARTSL